MSPRVTVLVVTLIATGYACSSTTPSNDDGGTDAQTSDSSNDVALQQETGSDAGPQTVTFSYTPEWTTVSAVSVYGGFGQSTDWMMPLLTLNDNGSGTFTGTAQLPAGQYLYVFKVVGDDAAGNKSATYSRYSFDPSSAGYAACPMASPTYDAKNPNPCSQLTVPQGTAPTMVHVTGTVVSGGSPIAGYLVVLERNETGSHHFFVNRTTTKNDGTYDLQAAGPGQYRLQIQYPTYISQTDEQRNPPTSLAALLRLISSDFKFMSSPIAVPNGEVAFNGYASFAPTVTGTLPTSFSFTGVGSVPTHLDVYGTGMDGGSPNIGDPWYSSAPSMTGKADFDGGFNTAQATETGVSPGERYFWGVEEDITTDAGVNWTAQTMVFDITWH
jgi:Carboxypeptidase regulatory-like domain